MKFILRRLAARNQQRSAIAKRASYGLTASAVGAASNLLLFVAKIIIGTLSGSIAIITDAINNLSDMLSSLVALVGFKVAAKKPDRVHPFGHERSETIAGFVIAILIMFVGFEFATSSIGKIREPSEVTFKATTYLVLLLSIGLKLWQVLFYRQIAKQIKSETLVATAKDSLNDVYTTVAVLLSAVIQSYTHWHLDGYVGLAVAIYIMISAVGMLRTFINDLLGDQPEADLTARITKQLDTYESILGYHDLLIHQYGANTTFATVHVELDSSWSLDQAHKVIDKIEHDFWHQLGIHLVCHTDPINIHSQRSAQVYEAVQKVIEHYHLGLKTHDFHVKRLVNNDHLIQFDVVVPESVQVSDDELLVSINHDLRHLLGDVTAEITFDHNYLMQDHSLI